ncbi:VOC family protein [Knoellia subterranea]|uniref:Glycosyltransferase n=1 Tax=Knoellia subterranea KCTC 19937 TaxID=1385521 RepID=A0A0A0JID9_9MICO|nr:VOC family protein [Knoellia subterranea]KGN37160.1 glycosyltransferase [Knoellia subterranea KCTC 19937]
MRVDHVVYAAEHDGARATAERLAEQLGVAAVDGGVHPRFGTRNVILPLLGDRYLEVVEVLDHPASDKAPFGQVVRARSENGGGWLGWVVGVDDISQQEERLGRDAVDGNRHRPDGVELRWKQLGIKGLQADPQLPFFIEWAKGTQHPSGVGSTQVALTSLEIAGDPDRVLEWLGDSETEFGTDGIQFTFVSPKGTPGIMSVTFETPNGPVTL